MRLCVCWLYHLRTSCEYIFLAPTLRGALVNVVYRYEELDDDEAAMGQRIRGALKYCVGMIVLILVLFLVGFLMPVARDMHGHVDLDYFKQLLLEDRRCISTETFRVMC